MKTKLSLVVAAVAAMQMGATDCGQVIRDPGFDLWCGDSLCTWKLLRGDIDQVGTWNAGDSGVSFLGTDTGIQQVAPVTSGDGNCIRFSMMSNVSDNAEVFLDIDLEADGSVERSERIPTAHWQPVSFLIYIKGPYDGIRFELAKTGAGEAVLANLSAEISGDCEGIEQITPDPRPNGAGCMEAADCASGLCIASPTEIPGGSFFGLVCTGCDPTGAACSAGQTCGIAAPLTPALAEPVECVPTAARVLGENCLGDAECASGICNDHSCSSCDSAAQCSNQTCGPSWNNGPTVCRPGVGLGATGTACGSSADCASDTCAGSERKECFDGRPCESPAECPTYDLLAPSACTTVGIQGGTCT